MFAVAACERRRRARRRNWRGSASAGRRSSFAATAGPRRDVVRRQRSRLPVRPVPQRPPDGAQAIAQVAQSLRLDRRGVAAVLRLPLPDPNVVEPDPNVVEPDPNVVEPDAAGGGEGGMVAGSSRPQRPLRRDFPGLQAGGGADPLRETVLRARGEPITRRHRKGSVCNCTARAGRTAEQLDLFADRTSTATMRANQLRLDFATFASRGGDSEGWPGRRRGGQGAGRFGRNFSRSPSAFRFGGFRSRFCRSGPGRVCSPGSWRTCGCRRPQPDAARGLDSPLAGTPATEQVCSGLHGVGVARNRKRSWFVQEKPCLPTAPCFPGPPVVQKNRVGNPDLASGFALVRYAGDPGERFRRRLKKTRAEPCARRCGRQP